jgi:hypothetical protein
MSTFDSDSAEDWGDNYTEYSDEISYEKKKELPKVIDENNPWKFQMFQYYTSKQENMPVFMQWIDDSWEELWDKIKSHNLEPVKIKILFSQFTPERALSMFYTWNNKKDSTKEEEEYEKIFYENKNHHLNHHKYDINYEDIDKTTCKFCKQNIKEIADTGHKIVDYKTCPNNLYKIFFEKDIVNIILDYCDINDYVRVTRTDYKVNEDYELNIKYWHKDRLEQARNKKKKKMKKKENN